MATCFLCGTQMVSRFQARDHLRPQVSTEYSVVWCAACEAGRVPGSFTPADVTTFYTPDYYTHVAPGESGKVSMRLSDRLRVHLSWESRSRC